MTFQLYTQGVPETIEILTVAGAFWRSFSDDCDLGVYTSRYMPIRPPILLQKSINSFLCASDRTRAIDARSRYTGRGSRWPTRGHFGL